jgi:hypothetical protein
MRPPPAPNTSASVWTKLLPWRQREHTAQKCGNKHITQREQQEPSFWVTLAVKTGKLVHRTVQIQAYCWDKILGPPLYPNRHDHQIFTISPLSCEKEQTHYEYKHQFCRKSRKVAQFHTWQDKLTNALTGRISPLVFAILEYGIVIFFTYHGGPLVERFVTHNSVKLKVAVTSFLQNRGDVSSKSSGGTHEQLCLYLMNSEMKN